MYVSAEHEPLDAAHRAHPNAGVLQLPAERPYAFGIGRGHGDDHLAHLVSLRQREGLPQRPEHRHTVQYGTQLGRIVVQEPDELDAGHRAFPQLSPDGEAVLSRPGDEDPARGSEPIMRLALPPLRVGDRPATQGPYPYAREEQQ